MDQLLQSVPDQPLTSSGKGLLQVPPQAAARLASTWEKNFPGWLPQLWNSLPWKTHLAPFLLSSKSQVKTELFRQVLICLLYDLYTWFPLLNIPTNLINKNQTRCKANTCIPIQGPLPLRSSTECPDPPQCCDVPQATICIALPKRTESWKLTQSNKHREEGEAAACHNSAERKKIW